MKNTATILSVSDLTRTIKRTLEQDFKGIAVQGELSNCKLHTSGHFYFTLKDESSQIQGVMWRSRVASLFFTPQDGMKIVARGNITVYEPRGVYQIDASFLQPLGMGELQLAFERLKERLSAEGLFDTAHKKPIPAFPRTIGIVTSETGAAIRDICSVIKRRFPAVQLILAPVKVQGSGAAEEIAKAINDFNRYGRIDAMIVGRGGGSLEDLWAFNEEVVARAIYNSNIPIISAVGHEIDFTIADFVADLRAPTPSAAAEMVVHDFREIVEIVRNFQYTSEESLMAMIQSRKNNILSITQSYAFNKPLDRLRQLAQRLDEYRRSLDRAIQHHLQLLYQQRMALHQRITALDPQAVLQRGYAIVSKNGEIISTRKKLNHGDDIGVQFHDGTVPASVQ